MYVWCIFGYTTLYSWQLDFIALLKDNWGIFRWNLWTVANFRYLIETKLTNFALFKFPRNVSCFRKCLFIWCSRRAGSINSHHVREIYGRGRIQVLRHENGNKWVRSHVQRHHRPQRIRLQFPPFLSNIVKAVVCFWLCEMRILISNVDQNRHFLAWSVLGPK